MTPPTSRRWLVAAGLLLAAFAALTLWVKFHGTIPGDERALRWASAHAGASEEVSGLYQLFGGLGSPYSAVLVTLTTAVVVLRNVGAAEAGVVLAGSAVAVLERPVAALVGYTDAAGSVSLPTGGYPSGHVLFAPVRSAPSAGSAPATAGRRSRRSQWCWPS